MTQVDALDAAGKKRYTTRMVILEEPAVAAKITHMAHERGHSVAAEVRGALRYWIAEWARSGEDDED
ncbi:MAG TPA: hypothetical protein VMN39_00410 [Longimicrobiaceae bacterium]|nr:hypothetical protein [Longimicrobiaceae bacterium]